jgi:hypothetical protein
MRSADEFREVQRLIALAMNDCAIAADRHTATDHPRLAPQSPAKLAKAGASSPCGVLHDFPALPPAPYADLLGLYLGDGCLSRLRRVWKLRIALDTKYPAIVERCRQAIDLVMPYQRASLVNRPGENCVEVILCSNHWPCFLPQHGPGPKHRRLIALGPWQQAIVDREPEEFIYGLIHSDGCRVVANDRGVRSIRYHFSNRSEDIIGLFTAALDRVGIHWTRSTKYIVSIYRKADTARLDEFVGPKDRAVPWTNVHYTA